MFTFSAHLQRSDHMSGLAVHTYIRSLHAVRGPPSFEKGIVPSMVPATGRNLKFLLLDASVEMALIEGKHV